MSLIGTEHTFFDESNDKTRSHWRSDNVVTKLDFDLLDLAPYQNQCQIGKFEFPFCLTLPMDVRPSFMSTERWFSKIGMF